ncbi:two-component system histidine kinase PnpS [Geomonas sp.]|uniref:two-component system histidine kinase PnpS n=1 Tax=Geomonas sp. TaxID=2651584 RepID=UPI002B45BD89|nr:phosphate regulon sensor histidine kinase PhoR [Geomonas sp.]HJV35484.1 phosphate regulon sensor histidine kinase PhoR [Geomonas sp.]
MKGSFRWKLMASYLVLVLGLGIGLYCYLLSSLERSMIAGTRDHLQDEVRVASLMASKEIADLRRDAPALTASLAKAISARVTVIAPGGEVVADSEVSAEELPKLENHWRRPEVQQALKNGFGSSLRYSATLRMEMMYVAAPFTGGGMIRLALPLSELERARTRLQKSLAAGLVVAVVVSLILSYILSNVNSRQLRLLAARASRIGRGEFGNRIPVTGSDELGRLAQVINDMTDRIEQQLERSSSEKNRLDAILTGMGEGVMVTDANGVITLVNPAFCAMLGTGHEVMGKQLLEITRHPDLYAACREVLKERSERHQEISLAEKQAILVHWVPLVEGDSLRGAVAVFHDISDLKRMERIRRDFVANVSHELRTPVTVIKGYAETLLSGAVDEDPERRERFLTIIHNHSDRLSSLVRDLLALSELESGDVALDPQKVLLEAAVKHALMLVEQRSEEKGISMEYHPVVAAFAVRADRRRLDQVLINLLDNAVKYSSPGAKVTVSAAEEGQMVRISVSDSGIGIPQKDLPRLFERFYRVDEARSRERGGTGLGLSIVKHIVQAHGGSISVESTVGVGSVFSFTLPKA